jgi:type I restriction enzyme S subunit
MELRPGYKQTVVGVIPEDWEVVSIGDIAKFTSGSPIDVRALHGRSAEYSVPVFGGNGIAGYTRDALVPVPSVVVGRVGQKCGTVYLSEGPAWITDNALYPKHIHHPMDMRFLALALEGARLNEVRNRNDLPLITQGIVHAVRIAWPPDVSEQRAIAAALSDVDALISGLDKLIAKKRDIKQAAMQQLLTGKKRLPGFSGEWEVKKLGEIGLFKKGRNIPKNQLSAQGEPCVIYGEIYTRYDCVVKELASFIPTEVAEQSTPIKSGDILFAGSGETAEEIGKCFAYIGTQKAYAGGDLIVLSPKEADSTFLGYQLNSPMICKQKAILGQGSSVVHIYVSGLATIEVPLPPLSEQQAIAAVLSDMDAEIAALEQRRDKTRVLKQGMMQELLTGKTRFI